MAATAVARDERILEYLRCEASFPHFLTHVKIRDANKGKIKLKLWPHLLQIATDWQTGDSWLEGKARQLGYSWLVAAYAVWILTFREQARVLAISSRERESIELLDKVKFIHANLPGWLRKELSKDSNTTFGIKDTEAQMMALPSTEQAGRSFQATVMILDEHAFHPYAGENYSAYHSAVADGGQEIFITTGNGPSGMFYNFYNDPSSPYRKRFNGWDARPDRDRDWYDREFATFVSAGEAHPLLFKRENPSSIEEMWTAFYGLVYDMFDPTTHVRPMPFTWQQAKWRVAGVDPGQGAPSAVIPIGESEGGLAYQFGEFYQRGVTSADDIAEYLFAWHRIAPFHGIFVDWAEGTLIATLQSRGLPAFPANKDRGLGIGLVASRLIAGNLAMSADCVNTISEYHSYRWKVRRAAGEADPYATSTPEENHGDAMDGKRYGLVGLSQRFSGKMREVQYPVFAQPLVVPDEVVIGLDDRDPLFTKSRTRPTMSRPDFSRRRGPVMTRR